MRKILLTSIFMLLMAPAAALCADNKTEAEPNIFAALEQGSDGKVEQVIDPLTVKLRDGRIIHLTGLDYPDYDPYKPGPFSVTALNVLRDFLKNQIVKVSRTKGSKTGRITRMGHEIAHVTRAGDDIWVQGMMIGLGLARVRTEKDNPEMSAEMYRLEQAARSEKVGIWELSAYAISSPEGAAARVGSFQIVEGRVKSVGMRNNTTYLNFGNNWKKDFTVVLSAQSRRDFLKLGINPMDWNGQAMRVRGWVGFFNGPVIDIDHPEAIELLDKEPQEKEESPEKESQTKASTKILGQEKPVFTKGDALPDANR